MTVRTKRSVKAKAVLAKIPPEEKKKGAIASGRFAVFGSLLTVGPAMVELDRMFSTKRGLPAHGHVTIKGKRFYYCLYGFVDDPDIYL